MRRSLVLLLLGVLTATAFGEEDPQESRSIAEAADAAVAATDEADRLKALASEDAPDPWFVVEELLRRNAPDVALAFATAAPERMADAMSGYVAARKGHPAVESEHKRLARIDAALEEQLPDEDEAAAVRRILGSAKPALDRVVRIRLAIRGAAALSKERRFVQSAERYIEIAKAADVLGWRTMAGKSLRIAGSRLHFGGKSGRAIEIVGQALAMHNALGDVRGAAKSHEVLGLAFETLGRPKQSHDAYQRALSAFEGLEDVEAVSRNHYHLGFLLTRVARYADAMKHYETSLQLAEEHGLEERLADAHRGIGIVLENQGSHIEAMERFERSLELWREIGDDIGVLRALMSVAVGTWQLGRLPEAVARFEELMVLAEEKGTPAMRAQICASLGTAYKSVGDLPQALRTLQRARVLNQEINDPERAADIELTLGTVYDLMGDYPKALSALESARAQYEKLGAEFGIAAAINNLGTVHSRMGESGRAAAHFAEALAINKRIGRSADIGTGLLNLAQSLIAQDEPAQAEALLDEALALARTQGRRAVEARVLASLGGIRRNAGDLASALELFRQGLVIHEDIGAKVAAAKSRSEIGSALLESEDEAAGVKLLEQAAREAESLRVPDVRIRALTLLALHWVERREYEKALSVTKEAQRDLEGIMLGLGDESGFAAREKHVHLLHCGAIAAAMTGDMPEFLSHVEQGRASLLLESLDHRRTLRGIAVSGPLQREEALARREESTARSALMAAQRAGKRKDVRRAAKSFDTAHSRMRDVTARIQREAKLGVQLLYPRAATIGEIQRRLEPHQALIVYSWGLALVFAGIVTPDEVKVVELEGGPKLHEAIQGLELDSVDSDTGEALARLRRMIADPIPLGTETTELIISPEGALNAVPFALMFEGRSIAMTQSATTHVTLSRDAAAVKGRSVLALGDPVYAPAERPPGELLASRGAALTPLPATRVEAEAVGDVLLLGKKANEKALFEAIDSRRRWRAVHLACHGLIEVERPTRSTLAMTTAGDDDGFLTVFEILRKEIPADLVVLSACQTAAGRVRAGEGVQGLTRTFMYAGASRVLCSLWRVDDDATRELMVKFYELWNPKGDNAKPLGAAAALQAAQLHVRDHPGHPEWKHPYYWAAWVLWGLP